MSEPEEELIWDDAAFKSRVRQRCAELQISPQAAFRRAGFDPSNWSKKAGNGGRGGAMIIALARALQTPAGYLMGDPLAANQEDPGRAALNRLALVSDIAAHLYVALSRASTGEADPKIIEALTALLSEKLVEQAPRQ